MRMLGSVGLAGLAALLPATAAFAADAAPPSAQRNWGTVPSVALQAPAGGPGWGPGGWNGGQMGGTAGAPLPPGHPDLGMPPHDGMGMGMAPHPGAPGPGGRAQGGSYATGGGYGSGYGGGYAHGGGLAPRRGYRLPGAFLTPPYLIGDWGLYGLTQPGFGNNWVRYYDGAALVDRDGIVQDYRDGMSWGARGGDLRRRSGNSYEAGFDDGYREGWEDGVDYAEDAVTYRGKWKRGGAGPMRAPAGHAPRFGGGYGMSGRGPRFGGAMPGPDYGYGAPGYGMSGYGSSGYGAPGYGGAAYGAGDAAIYTAPGGATVVVVRSGAAVTTTTTTVEETVSYAAHRRVWKKPVHVWRPAPRCGCRWKK